MVRELWNNQDFIIGFLEKTITTYNLKRIKFYDFEVVRKTSQPNKHFEYYLTIDLSVIDPFFKNYVYTDVNEIEKIEKLWKKYQDEVYLKLSKKKEIMNNEIIKATPLKLNLFLKTTYNKEKGKVIIGTRILNDLLGDIDSVIIEKLVKTKNIDKTAKSPRESKVFRQTRGYIYNRIFHIAEELKWIKKPPKLSQERWIILLNKFYFEGSSKMLKIGGEFYPFTV